MRKLAQQLELIGRLNEECIVNKFDTVKLFFPITCPPRLASVSATGVMDADRQRVSPLFSPIRRVPCPLVTSPFMMTLRAGNMRTNRNTFDVANSPLTESK